MDIGDEAENVTPITLQELEQKLLIEIRNNGLQDVEVQSMLHDCILASNKVAMRLLAKGREDASLECLKKAELLAGPSTLGDLAQSQDVIALRILTQNNLACWHRQRGQLETALAFLRSAEALSGTSKETPQRPRSPKVNDYLNPLNSDDEDSEATTQRTEASCQQVAVTHSNLCAILSELGHHAEALGHAKKAVLFCKQELRMVMKRHPAEHQFEDYSSRGGTTVSRGGTTVTPMPPKPVLKTLAALAIACYNMAVEMEFTEGKNCLQWYERSMKLAEDARAQEDVLSRIRRSLRLAQKKWLKKKRISSSSARSPNQEDHFPASPIKKEGFGVDNGQNYFYNGPSNTSIKDSDSSSAPSTHRGRRATLGYESRPRKPFQKKKQQPPNYRKGTESAGRKLKKSTWESKTEGDLSKAINKQSPLKQHHSDTAIGTKQRSPVLTLQQQIREMEKLTSSAKRAIREVYRNDAFQSAATTIQAHARGYIQRKGFVTKQGRQPNGNYSFSTSGETKLYGKSSGDINLTKAREEVAALQMQVGNLEAGLTLVREQRGEALELLQIKSARIQELVDSLQEAESDKDTLKEEINTLKEKLAESASKIDHLNIAFEAEKEKFKTLAAENEGVLKMSAAQSQEWSQMLSITQQEVTKLREEIGSEKQDKLMLIEKQAEVKQLEIQINSLETQMALKVKEKDQEIEEFKERASALQQEVEELKAEHLQIEENQEEKFNSLQVALSSEQERLLEEVSCNRKLTTALSDLQEEQKKAHFFSQEIERQMADLKQAKNALEKDQQSLKDQIQILEKEKQDALNQVATLEQGNNELKSKLKEQTQESAKESETKLDNLKIEMDKKWGAKIQSQTSNFQKDLSEQEQKNSCLEETNKALADEVSKLQKSVTRQKDLEAEVASMSEQLTQAQGDNEVFLNQISELKAKLNEMLASKETELRNFIDVQERNVQHQNEIEQKGTIIDAVAKEKETLEKKIDKINEELTRAKLENGELSKKNSDLADNLKKLRDENDLIRKEMQGLRASGTFDYLTNEEMDGMKDLLGVSEKAGMEAGKVLKEMLQTYKKSLATIAELEDLLKQSDDKLNIAEMNIQQLERTIGCLKLREAIDILNKKGTTASDTDANAQKDAMMKMLEDAQNIGDSNMQLANKMASMYSDSQIEIQKLKREVDLLRAEGKDDTITNLDSLMTTLIPAKSAEPDAPNNQSNNEDLVDDTQNSDVSLTRQLSSTRGKLRIATKAKETYKLKYEQSQRELLELKQSPGLGNNENACISEQKSNNFPPNSSGVEEEKGLDWLMTSQGSVQMEESAGSMRSFRPNNPFGAGGLLLNDITAGKSRLKKVPKVKVQSDSAEEIEKQREKEELKRTALLNEIEGFIQGHGLYIDTDKLQNLEEVGVGRFANVYKVIKKGGREPEDLYALKVFRYIKESPPLSILKSMLAELKVLSLLDHPNLIRVFGASTSPRPALVLEWVGGGNLYTERRKGSTWSTVLPREKIKILSDVAQGIAALHSLGIAHRDIKPHNILLQRTLDGCNVKGAVLADVGSCIKIPEAGILTDQGAGTMGWTAPEVLSGEGYGLEADIYSFGVIILETLLSDPPGDMDEDKISEVLKTITQSTIREAAEKCLLSKDPKCRPSADHLSKAFLAQL